MNIPAGRPDFTSNEPASTTPSHQWAAEPALSGDARASSAYAPYGEPRVFEPRKSRRAVLAGVVAVALLSAGIGGATGVVVDNYVNPQSTQSTASLDTSEGSTSTTVVQASATSPDWQATAAAVSPAVVAIQVTTGQSSGQGSGVIIDSDGTIVTNNHVIAGRGAQINVMIGSNVYTATIVGTDPSTDIAVIRLDDPPSGLQSLQFADSDSLEVGQPVMALGNPLGLSDTVTTGIISALNRPVTTQSSSSGDTTNGAVVTAAIQTNAAINPGNSGGALVNASGELIGITSSIASMPSSSGTSSGNIGIGFAIPANQVRNIVDQLLSTGTVQHAQLGVSARDTVSGTQLGAEIVQVAPGAAAAEAGLRTGDVITAVDQVPTTTSEALVAMIRNARVGEKVVVTYLRDQQEHTAEVTLGAASQ